MVDHWGWGTLNLHESCPWKRFVCWLQRIIHWWEWWSLVLTLWLLHRHRRNLCGIPLRSRSWKELEDRSRLERLVPSGQQCWRRKLYSTRGIQPWNRRGKWRGTHQIEQSRWRVELSWTRSSQWGSQSWYRKSWETYLMNCRVTTCCLVGRSRCLWSCCQQPLGKFLLSWGRL